MDPINLSLLSNDELLELQEKIKTKCNRLLINSNQGVSKEYDEVNEYYCDIYDELVARELVVSSEGEDVLKGEPRYQILKDVLMYVFLAGFIFMLLIGLNTLVSIGFVSKGVVIFILLILLILFILRYIYKRLSKSKN